MKYFYILSCIIFLRCNSENAFDCVQQSGATVEQVFEVADFERVVVFEGIQLVLIEGDEQIVMVRTGKNLLNDIEVSSDGDLLTLIDNNNCNYVRDYGITTVFVTTPILTEVRNSSSFEITNQGVLHFPNLLLKSEDFGNENLYHIDGDFNLVLDVGQISIVSNGFSNFHLSGRAERANFSLFASSTRIDASDLEVDFLTLYHRSSNRMFVNPQLSIQGSIVSVGDVISKNKPPVVEVEELYQGRLIFE